MYIIKIFLICLPLNYKQFKNIFIKNWWCFFPILLIKINYCRNLNVVLGQKILHGNGSILIHRMIIFRTHSTSRPKGHRLYSWYWWELDNYIITVLLIDKNNLFGIQKLKISITCKLYFNYIMSISRHLIQVI
jgi:hypothetical protein